jgi:hypothetical protein
MWASLRGIINDKSMPENHNSTWLIEDTKVEEEVIT